MFRRRLQANRRDRQIERHRRTDRQRQETGQRQEHPTVSYEQEAVVGNRPFMSSLYRTAHFDQTISVKPPSNLLSGQTVAPDVTLLQQ